ncbi:probable membrane-associated kinase regulator 2 [Malania oleifera]|uniref:probable membrane-associated kinase regulator 2 n=1 Tax=Malania oleifera TaxID=397392 RepID=UPI0025AE0597|nr:probable membrane-associated kinase regulator 2 [Malania oleifera]
MEAFSLLKYWRRGGDPGAAGDAGANIHAAAETTTIVTAVGHTAAESDEEDDDDGPFFDLEFAVPEEDEAESGDGHGECETDEEEEEEDEDESSVDSEDGTDDEKELNFTDPNLALSPSEDLFFKGRLVPIEPSSLVFNGSEANSKTQFASLLKSATKFRVFMLRFKKSKGAATEKTESNGSAEGIDTKLQQKQERETQTQQKQSKFTVKFKVEEVPIVSLFTRDNSSRVSSGNKSQKQSSAESASEENKRFSKEAMQKYLKMVKPLYVRVSRRYSEKLRLSGQLSLGSGQKSKTPPPAKSTSLKSEPETETVETPKGAGNVKGPKQGNIPAGLRVVCKRLGKSRSASSAVAAAPATAVSSKRRDDSLLQQQDGIQSAILHCKRSLNASGDSESALLSRSSSDPSHEKLIELSRNSAGETKGSAALA